jgi:hypothetical protein
MQRCRTQLDVKMCRGLESLPAWGLSCQAEYKTALPVPVRPQMLNDPGNCIAASSTSSASSCVKHSISCSCGAGSEGGSTIADCGHHEWSRMLVLVVCHDPRSSIGNGCSIHITVYEWRTAQVCRTELSCTAMHAPGTNLQQGGEL